MTRTIVTISEEDKKWLGGYSKNQKQSLAQTIRLAIKEFRNRRKNNDFKTVMEKAFGLWDGRHGDGVAYQRKSRAEWDR